MEKRTEEAGYGLSLSNLFIVSVCWGVIVRHVKLSHSQRPYTLLSKFNNKHYQRLLY